MVRLHSRILCCQTKAITDLAGLNWVPSAPSSPKGKGKGGKEEKGGQKEKEEKVFGELQYPDREDLMPWRLTKCGVYMIQSTTLVENLLLAQVQLLTPFCFKRNWKQDETLNYCQTNGLTFGENNVWLTSETVTWDMESAKEFKFRSPLTPQGFTFKKECLAWKIITVPSRGELEGDIVGALPFPCGCPFKGTVRLCCTCVKCRLLTVPCWPKHPKKSKQFNFKWNSIHKHWVAQDQESRLQEAQLKTSAPYLLFYSPKADILLSRSVDFWETKKGQCSLKSNKFKYSLQLCCQETTDTRRLGSSFLESESDSQASLPLSSWIDFLLWEANLWLEKVEKMEKVDKSNKETALWRLTKKGGDPNLGFEDCILDGCGTYQLVFSFASAAQLSATAVKNSSLCLASCPKEEKAEEAEKGEAKGKERGEAKNQWCASCKVKARNVRLVELVSSSDFVCTDCVQESQRIGKTRGKHEPCVVC